MSALEQCTDPRCCLAQPSMLQGARVQVPSLLGHSALSIVNSKSQKKHDHAACVAIALRMMSCAVSGSTTLAQVDGQRLR